LGYAFVQYYASKGWTVFALIRKNKSEVEAKITKEGLQNVHVFEADVTDAAALSKAAVEFSKLTNGTLDIFINNAARLGQKTYFRNISDQSADDVAEEFAAEFNVDVIGVALATNAFLPLIRAGTTKKVIVLATGLGDIDLTNDYSVRAGGVYSIAKAASNMLIAKYNAELGKEGVLFLGISPGMVDTGNADLSSEEAQKGVQDMMVAFSKYAPHFAGPITPEASIKAMTAVIDRATVETFGGKAVSHYGDQNWL